ncbi:unnamed protein product [Didymodactylos carnosus]|uniref:Mab-21-like HhH/H2TH-like domain-containing protein n=1 Tax=Didymodactylos carnosus TaxID=1234261 RepID=A0A8S2H711_9BILA|nr:unnamed protein product [Didymodactylos carnosus]CAF3586720.1 unnamed protein product [Didymodactylos carnosus]
MATYKDFLPPICPSRFSNHDDFERSLQDFYYEVVDIWPEYAIRVRKACRLIFDDLVPRLRKNRFGIVFNDPIFYDTFFENLQVVHVSRIKILIPLTIRPVEKERLDKAGYVYLKIPGMKDEELTRYDPWGFMRSKDREYLSPAVLVTLTHSLFEDALKDPYPIEFFKLLPLELDKDGPIIKIFHEQLLFTICFGFGMKFKKNDPYYISTPFHDDNYLLSKRTWRISYIESEMKCLKVLHRADHFRHAQAIKVFLALVKLDQSFSILNEDIIKALMVYICDDDLVVKNWNRKRCNEIFWSLFDLLYCSIEKRELKSPYIPDMNLFQKIDKHQLDRLEKHLNYIVEHQTEFQRFFNRRILSCKRRKCQTDNILLLYGYNRGIPETNEDDDSSSDEQENDNDENGTVVGTVLTDED